VAIITGAASGIGRASALLFAREGARLAVIDLNGEGAIRTVHGVESEGGVAISYRCDVSDPAQVQDAVDSTLATYGRIDILFNNAGIDLSKGVVDTTPDEWDFVLAVNLRSVFLMMRAVIPQMKRQRSGSIINMASGVGIRPRPTLAAYCTSKGGVIALSKAAATELGADGIRVNALCPGMIDTEMNRRVIESSLDPPHDPAQPDDLARKDALARMMANYPLGRMGTVDDVAYSALFLASSESGYITGTAFPVDGGRTLH
jgi:NAD(P)-dependent dehydrogenase (short-subunit alcohol dehydrogenase family)